MKEELKKYAESLKVKLEENEVEKFGRVLNEEQRRLIYMKELKEDRANQEKKKILENYEYFLRSIPPRYKDATFNNFEGQKEKIEFLKQGKSAVLCGGNGTGKTHLGFASCRYFAEKGLKSKYVLAYEFFEDIKNSFKQSDTEDVLKEYAYYDYLVIDEIDKAYGSQLEFIHLYHLINKRYNEIKPTILMTNTNKSELIELIGASTLDRIASEGAIIEMKGENYRQKK
jgi:DNA replication protein DnaC